MINSDSVAQDQIRAFIERIERLEEEKAAIADDVKSVYAEAFGNGFDKVVLRQIVRLRKQDASERMEREAILELYMAALGMQAAPRDDDDYEPTGRRANLSSERAPSITDSATHAADHGEGALAPGVLAGPITESRPDGTPALDRSAVPVTTSPAGVEGDADRHPSEPSSVSLGSVGSGGEEPNPVLVADPIPEPNDGQPGEKPSTAAAPTAGAIGPVAVAPAAPSSVVAFTPKPSRPHCLNREVCAGTGRNHCFGCETAFNAKGVEIPHQGSVA